MIGKAPNKSVNPDEVVAVGAALQAGVLAGEVRDVVLLDVTPLSLGVETLGGVMNVLIERNTTIPTRNSETYSTAEGNQTAVDIHVLQGERPMARDNMTLGRFRLEGIPPAPRGIPQIEVTFDIDANGVLDVKAVDKATGKEQNIRITASTNLSDSEVERLVQESEMHRDEDQAVRTKVELRNRADALAYQAEKALSEAEGVDEGLKSDLEAKIKTLREAVEADDAEGMETALQAMEPALHALSEAMYSAAQPEGGDEDINGASPDGAASEEGADDGEDVVEGEFREA
jgi:molecular chaperone DnaK